MSTHFALNPNQQALWLAHMSDPSGAQYQTAELVEFPADGMDTGLLARCITDCLEALEVFQARYPNPHTAVRVPNPIQVRHLDHRVDQPLDHASRLITTEAGTELSGAVLTAHWIFAGADGRVFWLARFHHICCDGFFVNTLIRWIAATFSARQAGQGDPPSPFRQLPSVPAGTEVRTPEPAAATADFWKELPVFAPDTIMSAPAADTLMVHAAATVDVASRQRLRACASAAGVSELEIIFGAAAHYCAVLSGSDQYISLGLPMMNRPMGQKLVEQAPTVTVLPLVVALNPARSPQLDSADGVTAAGVASALAQLRQHSDVLGHQIRVLRGLKDPQARLVGPHVNFRPFSPTFAFGDCRASLRTVSVGPINDCEFIVESRSDQTLEIQVMARGSNLRADVETHAARLANFLSHLPEPKELSRPLFAGRSVALPAELSAIAASNRTSHDMPAANLPELIARTRAAARPESHILGVFDPSRAEDWKGGPTWLTWQDVWDQVDSRAQALAGYGLGPGHVVAIHMERGEQFFYAVAACAQLGVAWCPVDPTLPVARRRHMVIASGAGLVITTAGDHDPSVTGAVPTLHTAVKGFNPEGFPGHRFQPTVDPECAYILFTSGSTGVPKAVAVPQRGIVNRLAWMCDWYGFGEKDVLLHKTPSSFDVSVWEYLLALTHGVPTALALPQSHRNPAEIAAQLVSSGATFCHFVPSALKVFLSYISSAQWQAGAEAFRLRAVISSGEALDSATANRAREIFGAQIHNLYGPAEAAIDVTAHTVTGTEQTIPIGAPVWNTQIHLVDHYFAPVPPGVPGTLLIGGVQVALGYCGQPELTDERFFSNPQLPATAGRVYNSGDIAAWRNGSIHYLGRADSQVKIHGQRLELSEISQVLSTHPQVNEAAVVLKHRGDNPYLAAFYIPTKPQSPTDRAEDLSRDLRELAAGHLPEYMVPTFYLPVHTLPLTPNGKLDVAALPEPALPPSGTAPTANQELTDTEKTVLEAFSAILGTPVTDVDVSFFALGGSSLSAVELGIRLAGGSADINVADIFATSTPRGLAALLDNRAGPAGAGGTSPDPTWDSSTAGPDHPERSARATGRSADSKPAPHTRRGFSPVMEFTAFTQGAPVLCFAPAGGLAWSYARLVHALHTADPGFSAGIFGMQSLGIVEASQRAESITQQASAAVDFIADLANIHGVKAVHLVGWSVGGVVAHEVATQLAQAHPKIAVAGLYLLDAYPPAVWQQLTPPTDEELWAGVLAMAGIKLDAQESTDPDTVLAALKAGNSTFAALEDHEIHGIRTMVKHNARLMREHTAGSYPGHALHYTAVADEAGRSELIRANAWLPLVGNLESERFEVSHPGMVGPEVLQDLARKIVSRTRTGDRA
ncbi:hypothetical protein CPHO_11125 [Corynebacterium phocae]|uniref:Carrier domain-containing protein n=1 Tax=Corynebacterium phocae TaxID=161895 RepID=A0A1L7D5G4_9CORY|nr:non-ribosomal peptide synthetase [Corynebacterium phocae]APT93350.1 hypothetical protein CPHO_11125 [Corynebacterium phocae]KAA8721686.1 non-ribosomal peptide synthetase [Corynebacterium phocae]